MPSTPRVLLTGGLACLLAVPAAVAAPPLADANLGRLEALIRPEAAEQKWEQIPWRASLWAARREAAEHGKPILLWEMDGHPLGCT
ncbi:MAG TPA: hypothetical protein VJ739_14855 [Gemmataceae bacterium]|nr:hypothetical protein [Gemmataceae bacterium]